MNRSLRLWRWGLFGGTLLALVLAARGGAAPPEGGGNNEKLVSFTVEVRRDPFGDGNARQPGKEQGFLRGERVLIVVKGTPRPGWHTYPILKTAPGQDEFQLSKLTVTGDGVAPLWPVTESEPKLATNVQGQKEYEFDGPFTWTQEVLIRPDAPPGQTVNVGVEIELQACDPNTCRRETHKLTVPVLVSDAAPLPLTEDLQKLLKDYDAKHPKPRDGAGDGKKEPPPPVSQTYQQPEVKDSPNAVSGGQAKATGLWATVVTGILGGLISLVTPCVFPMIPVTVSFFLKRAEKKEHRALTMAAVYCGTIVLVLTLGGMALVSVLQTVSQHWATNFFLTAIFVFFALSLLGMYEIQLPSGLANLTASREGQGGLTGIVFMALTFSIISFACVGPIYGGFITLQASDTGLTGWLQRFLGPFAFAVAFAAPFFLLALFPSLLRSLPKSGSWMNSVKVVMGFLELAAAFKFVRAAELNLLHKTNIFTFDLCLAAYVALSLGCGLYLLGVYRLPHDHEAPETIGVGRLIWSLTFLTLGLYLLPGLFKDNKGQSQRSRGGVFGWVSAFLLPDDSSDWQTDLRAAMAQAERENKPLFIDFTGLG
jgi:thiol:disulfide interchange protein DsbD